MSHLTGGRKQNQFAFQCNLLKEGDMSIIERRTDSSPSKVVEDNWEGDEEEWRREYMRRSRMRIWQNENEYYCTLAAASTMFTISIIWNGTLYIQDSGLAKYFVSTKKVIELIEQRTKKVTLCENGFFSQTKTAGKAKLQLCILTPPRFSLNEA